MNSLVQCTTELALHEIQQPRKLLCTEQNKLFVWIFLNGKENMLYICQKVGL